MTRLRGVYISKEFLIQILPSLFEGCSTCQGSMSEACSADTHYTTHCWGRLKLSNVPIFGGPVGPRNTL